MLNRSRKAVEFLEVMTHAARIAAKKRGWTHATQVTLFIPQRAIELELDVDGATIWRWFKRYGVLRARIAKRPHYGSLPTSFGHRTVVDGTLWTVSLREGGRPPRVPFEQLKAKHRDLALDVANGATFTALLEARKRERARARELQGSRNGSEATSTTPYERALAVLGWSSVLVPSRDACTFAVARERSRSWSLEDAAAAVRAGEAPELLAVVIARELRDRFDPSCWLREVREFAARGRLEALVLAVRRALVDAREGAARNAAALLTWRLRKAPPAAVVSEVLPCGGVESVGMLVDAVRASRWAARPPSGEWVVRALLEHLSGPLRASALAPLLRSG